MSNSKGRAFAIFAVTMSLLLAVSGAVAAIVIFLEYQKLDPNRTDYSPDKTLNASVLKKLNDESDSLKKKVEEYKDELDGKNALSERLAGELDRKKEELGRTKTQRDEYRKTYEETADQLEKTHGKLEQTRKDRDRVVRNRNKMVADLTTRIDSLSGDIARLTKENDGNKQKVKRASERARVLKAQLGKVTGDLTDIRTKLVGETSKNARLKVENNGLQDKNNSLQDKNAELGLRIDELKKKLKEAEDAKKEPTPETS